MQLPVKQSPSGIGGANPSRRTAPLVVNPPLVLQSPRQPQGISIKGDIAG